MSEFYGLKLLRGTLHIDFFILYASLAIYEKSEKKKCFIVLIVQIHNQPECFQCCLFSQQSRKAFVWAFVLVFHFRLYRQLLKNKFNKRLKWKQ